MTTTMKPPPAPVAYVVWCKPPGRRRKWEFVARTATHAEAVAMVSGKGDWHIAPLVNPALAPIQPGLFDH